MDPKFFIESFKEVNSRFIALIGSLSALRELSALEIGNSSEKKLLEVSLQTLVNNLDFDFVAIHEIKDEQFSVKASIGCDQLPCDQMGIVNEMLHDFLITTRNNQAPEYLINCRDNSYILLPLVVNDELLAVFTACHPKGNYFDQEHIRSLTIFCNFLAQLVMNNRLLMEMEGEIQKRTRELEDALEQAQLLKVRYETLSVVDELTELHNRRFFFPEAKAALSRAIRYSESFTILMMDIDRFKSINDKYGHTSGDEVLKSIAKLIKAEAREADIVSRLGGEEFVAALPETDIDGATVIAERIRKKITQLKFEEIDPELQVTMSIGIADISFDERDSQKALDMVINHADAALYYSKEHGRDCTCLYKNGAPSKYQD